MMVVKNCIKFSQCLKIQEVVDDFSLLAWQKAEMIVYTCENCSEREEK
jgi:hypothetical protein